MHDAPAPPKAGYSLAKAGNFLRHHLYAKPKSNLSIRTGCGHSERGMAICTPAIRLACGAILIMPDHVHFFCAPDENAASLSQFVGGWKRWTSRRISNLPRTASAATGPIWQREFFDHVLRSQESYDQKWNYVRDNPVRAGFVLKASEWSLPGEIDELRLCHVRCPQWI